MTADETAKKLKGAKTDSDRHITYDPEHRPEVANLLTIAAMCEGGDPASIAEEIGDGGGGGLKKRVTEAVNDLLRAAARAAGRARRRPGLSSTGCCGGQRARQRDRRRHARRGARGDGDVLPVIRVPTLTDGVVTLRGFGEDDVPAVLEQCSDPGMQAWTSMPVPYVLDDAKTYVRHVVPGGWATGREWAFAFSARDDQGTAGSPAASSSRCWVTGWSSSATAPAPGRVAAASRSAPLRLLLQWGFEEQRVQAVEWVAKRWNWPSRRLAWRLGFAVGQERSWMQQRGALVPAWRGTLARGEELAPRHPWYDAPVLRGADVVLRPLADGDLPRMLECLADPGCSTSARGRASARPTRSSAGRTWSRSAASGRRAVRRSPGPWPTPTPTSTSGSVQLYHLHPRRQAELGFWAHPDARGRGLTTQAVRVALRHAFVPWDDGGLGLRRVHAARRLGQHGLPPGAGERPGSRAGTTRSEALLGDGTWSDTARYDLLAQEWGRAGA